MHPVAVGIELDIALELVVAQAGYQVGCHDTLNQRLSKNLTFMEVRLTWTVTVAGAETFVVGLAVHTGAVPD